MRWDRRFLLMGLGYAVLGMALGNWMGMSHDHGQHVTHAHVLLVGFVVSTLYALIHKLWLPAPAGRLAALQFAAHQIGAAVMSVGLFLMFGGQVAEAQIGPVLGLASMAVLLGAVLMAAMVLRQRSAD